MLTPIRCITCGLPTGDVATIYSHLRAKKVTEHLKKHGITPTMSAAADASLKVDMSDILDSLGIEHDCCRKTLTSNMEFLSYY